ncbi:MAG: hypothetical protein LBU70_06475 [Chitinispirillales bacterium]|jgi:hypothetical protein|nr:hypothetical protein [Chitinispirillales bacterium]
MIDLHETISEFSDEKLLEKYAERSEYTEEAVKIYEAEIAKRGLDPDAETETEEQAEAATKIGSAMVKTLNRENFESIGRYFSKVDIMTANAILRDSNITYIVEKHKDDDNLYDILVYKNHDVPRSRLGELLFPGLHRGDYEVDKAMNALTLAQTLIEEHFEAGSDNRHVLRKSDIVDRIKSFSPYDIKLCDKSANEPLDVDFENREKAELIKLAEMLLDETDRIEEETGRIVFFHDSLETLIGKLKNGGDITRTDFLAILEICQIYCDDPRYNPALNSIAASILDFFWNDVVQ